jgi:hypothetical protein
MSLYNQFNQKRQEITQSAEAAAQTRKNQVEAEIAKDLRFAKINAEKQAFMNIFREWIKDHPTSTIGDFLKQKELKSSTKIRKIFNSLTFEELRELIPLVIKGKQPVTHRSKTRERAVLEFLAKNSGKYFGVKSIAFALKYPEKLIEYSLQSLKKKEEVVKEEGYRYNSGPTRTAILEYLKDDSLRKNHTEIVTALQDEFPYVEHVLSYLVSCGTLKYTGSCKYLIAK